MPTFTSHIYDRFRDRILNMPFPSDLYSTTNSAIQAASQEDRYYSQVMAMGLTREQAREWLETCISLYSHSTREHVYSLAIQLVATGAYESIRHMPRLEPLPSNDPSAAVGLFQINPNHYITGPAQEMTAEHIENMYDHLRNSTARRPVWIGVVDEDVFYHPGEGMTPWIPTFSTLSISVCICERCMRPDNGHSIILQDGDTEILELPPQSWEYFGQEQALSHAQDKMDEYALANNVY